MHTTKENDRILFLYLRNPKDEGHVATIARFKKGNQLTFAWAVNKVTRHTQKVNDVFLDEKVELTSRKVHDTFSKKMGRQIAEGRLAQEHSRVTLTLQEGERPVRALLTWLAKPTHNGPTVPKFLSKWASMELDWVYEDEYIW